MKLDSGSLPVAVRDSEERLSKGGVYLLETGLHLFLWVGASVQQELLLNIFGTPSFSQIDSSMVRGNLNTYLMFLLFINSFFFSFFYCIWMYSNFLYSCIYSVQYSAQTYVDLIVKVSKCPYSCFQMSLPVLDNPISQRLREVIDSFRAQRSRYMKASFDHFPYSCDVLKSPCSNSPVFVIYQS